MVKKGHTMEYFKLIIMYMLIINSSFAKCLPDEALVYITNKSIYELSLYQGCNINPNSNTHVCIKKGIHPLLVLNENIGTFIDLKILNDSELIIFNSGKISYEGELYTGVMNYFMELESNQAEIEVDNMNNTLSSFGWGGY